ncbi:MAG TPA: methyltransferase domain-containing protein [Pseudonocardiaceae bacterium]|nr:methyltransferase domain-containing protein [Pseudonocardiaceae bacterium]
MSEPVSVVPDAPPEARYTIDGGLAGMSRLDILAEIMWPTSAALLAAAGVPVGARCLDLGCGGGHISVELAGLAGPTGSVVGVDIDAEIIDLARAAAAACDLGNLEFRLGTADDFGGGPYDLGYVRFLLSHVADPQRVVSGLAAVIPPGGKVIVEDTDFTGAFCFPRSDAYARSVQLYQETVRRRGGNADIGPELPALLRTAGLEDVQVRAVQPVSLDGGAKAMCVVSLERTATAIVEEGIASAEEVAAVLAELRVLAADRTTLMSMPRIVQSWGVQR